MFWKKEKEDLTSLMRDVRDYFERTVKEKTNALMTRLKNIEELEKEKIKLKEEIADLKLKKKHEEEDTKFLVKKREEMFDLEKQKFELEQTKKADAEIAKVKDAYRDKVEKGLETSRKELKEMYAQILELVPKVQVALDNAYGKKED